MIVEEQLVSKKVAILAKEKGFTFWPREGKMVQMNKGEKGKLIFITLPTQSLLQNGLEKNINYSLK